MFSKRKPLRLKKYDYSKPGYYFVTICAQDRQCLFGNVDRNQMILNRAGKIINQWWLTMSERFENIGLDEYKIMPNHLHGIIVIKNVVGDDQCVGPNPKMGGHIGPPLQTMQKQTRQQQLLFRIIQLFKTKTTNGYINGVKNNQFPPFNKRLWQRSYCDHIIRNEKSLDKIRQYIRYNHLKWDEDIENPIFRSVIPRSPAPEQVRCGVNSAMRNLSKKYYEKLFE